jgi:multidrug resistance protein
MTETNDEATSQEKNVYGIDSLAITSPILHIPSNDAKQDREYVINCDSDRFTTWQQYKILILVSLSSLLSAISVAIYMALLSEVKKDLNATYEQIIWSLSVYMFVLGLMPLIWGPLSDNRGRKWILCIAILEYAVATLLCAFSWNVYILAFFRFFQAAGAAAPVTIGAGVVADTFAKEKRGRAMGLYSITPIIAVIGGPLLGGFFGSTSWTWRGAFLFLFIISIIIGVNIAFLLPETLREKNSSSNLQSKIWNNFKYLKNIQLICICIFNGISYGAYSTMQIHMSPILDKQYGLKPLWIGIAFIPAGLGILLGNYTGGYFSDYFAREYRACESRLIVLMGSFPFLSINIYFMGQLFQMKKIHLLILLTVTFFTSFFFALGRPAVMTFSIEKIQELYAEESASSVSGLIYSIMYFMSAISMQLSSILENRFRTGLYFSILACLISIGGLIVIIISLSYLSRVSQNHVIPGITIELNEHQRLNLDKPFQNK